MILNIKKEKIKKNSFNTILYLDQNFICGSFYYAIEYFDYLLKNNIDIYLFLPRFILKYYSFLIQDKYNIKKLHSEFFNKIIFFDDLKKIIKTKNILIIDSTSYKNLSKFIIANNIFYNYANNKESLEKEFYKKDLKKVNYYIFGDKEMGCKIDYHYPLCLNFKIFKDIKEIKDGEYDDSNKLPAPQTLNKRLNKNFHASFNTLKYTKNENVWERANRLIPECKFYNKKIIFEPKSYIDSAQLRYERNWKDYSIWDFKSPDTGLSFADWIKEKIDV